MSGSDDSDTIPEPVAAERRSSAPRLSLDRYRLDAPIGRGGMGEVSSARDLDIGRDVAIKRLLDPEAHDSSVRRFFREARIQGRLDHPAIVPVHDVGRDVNGRPFFTMKKLAGTTLRAILDDPTSSTRYPRERLLRALADVCLAIELAHTRGIIHRDIKPANIILGDFGEVYVLDWGVAKVTGETAADIDEVSGDQLATQTGSIIGTVGYMAPEQIRGVADLDGRADVYALGCLLFEILTGERLHPKGHGVESAMTEVDARPSHRVPDREIPPELDQLCVDATAFDRDARIATARELGERVLRYLDGDRDLVQRRTLARQHLEAGVRAFATPDDETSRQIAMREAGRALALDPSLVGAAELVGRLMLEPPRSLPREVEQRIARDGTELDRSHARVSSRFSLAYLMFLPFMIIGHTNPILAAAFAAAVVTNVIVVRRGVSRIVRSPYLTALRNGVLIAIMARAFSPFFVAPAVAGLVVSALLLRAEYTRTRTVVVLAAMLSAGVLVPWVLEAFGLISSTMHVTRTSLVFVTFADLPPAAHYAASVAFTLGIVGVSAALAHAIHRTEAATKRRLYLQTWQLEQLVPR